MTASDLPKDERTGQLRAKLAEYIKEETIKVVGSGKWLMHWNVRHYSYQYPVTLCRLLSQGKKCRGFIGTVGYRGTVPMDVSEIDSTSTYMKEGISCSAEMQVDAQYCKDTTTPGAISYTTQGYRARTFLQGKIATEYFETNVPWTTELRMVLSFWLEVKIIPLFCWVRWRAGDPENFLLPEGGSLLTESENQRKTRESQSKIYVFKTQQLAGKHSEELKSEEVKDPYADPGEQSDELKGEEDNDPYRRPHVYMLPKTIPNIRDFIVGDLADDIPRKPRHDPNWVRKPKHTDEFSMYYEERDWLWGLFEEEREKEEVWWEVSCPPLKKQKEE